jgi:Neprosin
LSGPGFNPNRINPKTWDKNIPFPKRTVLGGEADVSQPNGVQYEHRFDLFQGPNGDWWIGHNWELLGHYPAALFSMLNKGACRAHWYSEIYDGTPQDWTYTDMGSGLWPQAGANQVAYIRRPAYREPVWVEWEVPLGTGEFSKPYEKACYTRTALASGGPFVGNYFFYTGPGGDSEGCD